MGLKGLERCTFEFDILKWQDSDPYLSVNFKPINFNDFSQIDLLAKDIKFITRRIDNRERLAVIKWRLDDPDHIWYIHEMLQHVFKNSCL